MPMIFTACASLPPPPKGQLCVFNAKTMMSNCVQISPKIVKKDDGQLSLDLSNATIQIPASNMENWITTDPDSWKEIQIYINRLKVLAQRQCQ